MVEGFGVCEVGITESFRGGEVEEEDAIGSGRSGIIVEGLKSVGVDGIEVGKENERGFVGFPEGANEIEHAAGGHAGLEGPVGRELVDDAVGHGIGEGDADFDDVGPGLREGVEDFQRAIKVGVASGDVGDKGFTGLLPKAGECGIDAISHERRELGDGRRERQAYPAANQSSHARTSH